MYSIIYHDGFDLSKHAFLVTGGAGFIGSNLVEYLLKYNAGSVRVIDNLSTGKMENIEPFLKDERFEFIEADIRYVDNCREAVKGIDYVLHQAALGSVPKSIIDPISANDVNIGGFINMMFACKESHVKRFIYASSSSVYGDSMVSPKVEDTLGNTLSPYAVTKLADELYASVFSKVYGIKFIGLRYFNVFGPRQDPNGDYAAVIPKFISRLLKEERPVINGNGNQTRDFTYIENVVQVNIKAIITDNEAALDQVYNVACGESVTIMQVVDMLKMHLAQYSSDIKNLLPVYNTPRSGDIIHSLASIAKARSLLDYKPMFLFKEGLKEVLQWYIEHHPSVSYK